MRRFCLSEHPGGSSQDHAWLQCEEACSVPSAELAWHRPAPGAACLTRWQMLAAQGIFKAAPYAREGERPTACCGWLLPSRCQPPREALRKARLQLCIHCKHAIPSSLIRTESISEKQASGAPPYPYINSILNSVPVSLQRLVWAAGDWGGLCESSAWPKNMQFTATSLYRNPLLNTWTNRNSRAGTLFCCGFIQFPKK